MKEERKELLKSWRSISWWDKLRACYQKTPATFGEYNQAYSDFVISLLSSEDLVVEDVSKYRMDIKSGGRIYSFWIGNYPYSYGDIKLPVFHKWFHSNLNWEAVLKVRELQLKQKDKFFKDYDKDQSKL
tara:strand:- start:61 stop:447 length:387 start_codon:yes stop_codon:yes gene_type:complete